MNFINNFRFNKLIIILNSVVIFLLSGCCEEGTRTDLSTESRETWIGVVGPFFSNIELRLNNYQSERHAFFLDEERAYFIENDSYFSILGRRTEFTIPLTRQEPSSIYVDDINSESISIDARKRKVVIQINMESQGRELWTNCVANFNCGAIGNRDINVDEMFIEIYLDLIVENGSVTYDPSRVNVMISSPNISIDGCEDNFFAFLCDLFLPDRESQIKNKIADGIKDMMNRDDIRSQFSDAMMRYVRDVMDIDGNIGVAFINNNGDLNIVYSVPDPSCN